jgi:hypothetical protein
VSTGELVEPPPDRAVGAPLVDQEKRADGTVVDDQASGDDTGFEGATRFEGGDGPNPPRPSDLPL